MLLMFDFLGFNARLHEERARLRIQVQNGLAVQLEQRAAHEALAARQQSRDGTHVKIAAHERQRSKHRNVFLGQPLERRLKALPQRGAVSKLGKKCGALAERRVVADTVPGGPRPKQLKRVWGVEKCGDGTWGRCSGCCRQHAGPWGGHRRSRTRN